MRRCREILFSEGDPPISGKAATPRGGEDDSGSPNSGSEPMEPVEEVLGRPTVDHGTEVVRVGVADCP